jgi:ribosomal-protein-alanine N-acetyltransferase
MTPGDLDRVVEIAWSLKDAPHWPLAAYMDALDPNAALQRIALVAAETGAIVGFTVASLLAPQSELETIAVAAGGQRRGVGGRLFSGLVEELNLAEIHEVILEVRASNLPAFGFYRALGFSETGRRPRYYADPQEDALLLGLRLRDCP